MNKRLRKKKRCGEFTEYGVNIRIEIENVSVDTALDSLIAFVEAHDLALGGGIGSDGCGEIFVTAVRPCKRLGPGGVQRYLSRSVTESDRAVIQDYLTTAPFISYFEVGLPVDAWH